MKKLFSPGRIVAVVIILIAIAAGYHFYTSGAPMGGAAPGGGGGFKMPPAVVTVETMKERNVRLWTEFSGRMTAVDYAQIRPEVSGRIMEVRFQDGQSVKAGDILVVIDPRPYAAAVEKAQANLASARSRLDRANLDVNRGKQLIQTHAIAQNDMDNYDNTEKVAAADVQSADAALTQAKLDLEHAYVMAPISGRTSRAEITVGNLVESGISAPVLTSIVSQDGIYADFEVDEQTYMQTVRNTANGNDQESKIPVQLTAQGDSDHAYNGFIQSFDNKIDPTSGTIRARARFDNKDGALVPGMFVSVKLAGSKDLEALLVPDRAVGFDQDKKFVYVVDDSNKVSYREVELGKQVNSERVVESGLHAGDRVIVDGIQHVHPNDVVVANEMASDNELIGTTSDGQMAKTARP